MSQNRFRFSNPRAFIVVTNTFAAPNEAGECLYNCKVQPDVLKTVPGPRKVYQIYSKSPSAAARAALGEYKRDFEL